MPPGGLPEVFLEGGPDSLEQLVLRFARGRGPFTTADANASFGRDVEAVLAGLERADKLVRGELRPGGTEREWCEPDVLRRLRRASLAALRREVEPAEQAALGRFLPSWHGIGRRASLREALVPLQALPLPVSLWESDVLPRRVPGYQPASLDALCASGEVVWVGAGLDRVAIFFREDAPLLGQPAGAQPPESEEAERLRAVLGRGAEFWYDLLAAAELDAEAALPALWELVWAGEVTNDAWTPLRAGRRYGVPRPQRARAPLLAPARRRDHRDPGPLVARRPAVPPRARATESRSARARRAAARAAGHRHARRRPRGGDRRRLRRRLRRAEGARDARHLPPRLLRRGARRRAVRPRGRGRAAARAATARGRRGRAARARGRRPGTALRRGAAVAEAGGSPRGARRRRAGDPARRRAGALRRARRALARAAARSGSRSGCVPRSRRSSRTCARAVRSGSRSSASTARRSAETEVMPLLVEAGFLAGPRRAVLRP